MTRRPALIATVLAALALALAGALLARAPHDLPTVALGAALVWRAEVATVLFAAAYGAIVTARLALHGHTYTRVGSAGIEIPQVARMKQGEESDRITGLETTVAQLEDLLATVRERIATLEDPRHELLKDERKGTYDANDDSAERKRPT